MRLIINENLQHMSLGQIKKNKCVSGKNMKILGRVGTHFFSGNKYKLNFSPENLIFFLSFTSKFR